MNIHKKPMNILVIDDDVVDRKTIIHHLRQCLPNVHVRQANCVKMAQKLFEADQIDFVFSDYRLPDGTGMDIIEHILNLDQFIPVVLLTGFGDEELAVEALQKGACDYLNKDHLSELRVKQAIDNSIKRRSVEAKIYHLAHYDQLTKLFNRTHFEDRLQQAFFRAERFHTHFAVMFLDLDGFKQINDQYGHEIGDMILEEVAERLRYCVRDIDTVARFGGDEFAIILEELQGDDQDCCSMVGYRILESINRPFSVKGRTLQLGISVGVAIHASHTDRRPDDLLKMADEAMYEAKRSINGMPHLRFKS